MVKKFIILMALGLNSILTGNTKNKSINDPWINSLVINKLHLGSTSVNLDLTKDSVNLSQVNIFTHEYNSWYNITNYQNFKDPSNVERLYRPNIDRLNESDFLQLNEYTIINLQGKNNFFMDYNQSNNSLYNQSQIWSEKNFYLNHSLWNHRCDNQLGIHIYQSFFINLYSLIFLPNLLLLFFPLKKFIGAWIDLRDNSDLLIEKYTIYYNKSYKKLFKKFDINKLTEREDFIHEYQKPEIVKMLYDIDFLSFYNNNQDKHKEILDYLNIEEKNDNGFTIIKKKINPNASNINLPVIKDINKVYMFLDENILSKNRILRNIKLLPSPFFFLVGKSSNYIKTAIDFNEAYEIYRKDDFINNDNIKIFFTYSILTVIGNLTIIIFNASVNHILLNEETTTQRIITLIFMYTNISITLFTPLILYGFKDGPLVYLVDILLTLSRLLLLFLKSVI